MTIPCARCDSPLPLWELASGDAAVCKDCGSRNTVRVFPALLAPPAAPALAETAIEGAAVCFDHLSNRAVSACQQCGRFVCRLCSVELSGGVWCPACFIASKGPGK